MILKASNRAGAKQLADHLLNAEHNEHVDVNEVRGFMSDTLSGALNEIYAHAQANQRIKKFLFSMSVNPPKGEVATKADITAAIDEAENRLGLQGQPRVVVFHEKEGRRHAHAVWSRVDEHCKAIKLDYFKRELTDLSRELYIKHGWALPKGLQNDKARDLTNYSLSEHQAAKRHNVDPKAIKAEVQACWHDTDDKDDFIDALAQTGFILAKGDKRNFVIVDAYGEVRSLSRTLSLKVKDIKPRLGESEQLPTVETARTRFTRSHHNMAGILETLDKRHAAHQLPIQAKIRALSRKHKKERTDLDTLHQTRQTNERKQRQAQYQKGLKGLWNYVTGRYHKLKQYHEDEYRASIKRDAQEKEALFEQQLKAREILQNELEQIREKQKSERLTIISNIEPEVTRNQEFEMELAL